MPALTPSPTELTTAATDAAMAVLCAALLARLGRLNTPARFKQSLWGWVFCLLGAASVLGAIAHGLDLTQSIRDLLWIPLYLSLGLAVALFFVGAVLDWRGSRVARRLLPWALGVAAVFFVFTQWLGGAFVIFVVYEAAAMLLALAIYLALSTRHVRGASVVSAGIGLSMVAAAVQASSLQSNFIVPLDHNGLFHVLQFVATLVIAHGIRGSLVGPPRPDVN